MRVFEGQSLHHDERGLTLVEMMVAFVVLGVILAATAGSLITFGRASIENERRVQGTALLNRLHEELQALPWQFAALYEDEVATVTWPANIDIDLDLLTYEGDDLVVLDGPGAGERIPTAPLPFEVLDVDGRDYQVYRLISWVDRDGNDPETIKRFTTVVRWESLGRTVEQRFDSERAPTPTEAATGSPSVSFLVTSTIPLSATGFVSVGPDEGHGLNAQTIEFFGDFTQVGGVDSASVFYEAIDGGLPTAREVPLTRVPGTETFQGAVAVGGDRFSIGSQSVTLVGLVAGTTLEARATVEFLPPAAVDPSSDPPFVRTPVSATPSSVRRAVHAGQPGRLCQAITVQATIDDLQPDGSVTVSYPTSSGTVSSDMSPVGAVTGSADLFRFIIPQYAESPWIRTAPGNSTQTWNVVFTVSAANPGDPPTVSNQVSSAQITVSGDRNSSC